MRYTRLRDLVESLDFDVSERLPGGRLRHKDRALRKDELIRLCERLGYDHPEEKTVPELRQMLREDGHGRDKSPHSRFSSSELFNLIRALKHAKYMSADEVDVWDDIPKWGGKLLIDDEHYEVTEKSRGRPHTADELAYSTYEAYYLRSDHGTKRLRLMVLRNLDTDMCQYEHSVVLEKAKDYGPYKRWVKKSYVEDVSR